jgi:alpha-1,6-mannosyltransferase
LSNRASRVPGSRRVLAWTSAACIAISLLVMIGVSAAGPSIVVPDMARTSGAPPWWGSLNLGNWVLFVMWGTAVVAAIGVGAGLIAVARGARPPVKALLAASFIAVAAFAVLPPGGSTDAQSYALDGSMVVLNHSPYVDTPAQMVQYGDQFAADSPQTWLTAKSDYGPLATAEEWLSAELGGWSLAQVTFWLKLWVELAFVAVTLLLDRALRSNAAMRLRAHLLWSLNPLLLWEIVAAGHIDGLAIAFGLAGLLTLRFSPVGGSDGRLLGLPRCAAAGALIGLAADIKSPFLLFGLGAAWAVRRSPAALAALGAGAAAILVPSYFAFGTPAVNVLFDRGYQVTWDNLYQVIYRPLGLGRYGGQGAPGNLTMVALGLFLAVALLAFFRLPDRVPGLPAVTPALALTFAWIFIWPFQRPWYDVMVIALLALYPRSWLDWVVLARLCSGAIAYMESTTANALSLLQHVQLFQGEWITSSVRLLAVVALVWMCVTRRWGFSPETGSAVDNPPPAVYNPVGNAWG